MSQVKSVTYVSACTQWSAGKQGRGGRRSAEKRRAERAEVGKEAEGRGKRAVVSRKAEGGGSRGAGSGRQGSTEWRQCSIGLGFNVYQKKGGDAYRMIFFTTRENINV